MKSLKLVSLLLSLSVISIDSSMAMDLEDFKSEHSLHQIPEFPIHEYGEDIEPRSYIIQGKDLKRVLIDRDTRLLWSYLEASTKPKNEVVYFGAGLWATNLGDEYYKDLRDFDVYFVKCDRDGDEWEINGVIPQSYKIFTVRMDRDYQL